MIAEKRTDLDSNHQPHQNAAGNDRNEEIDRLRRRLADLEETKESLSRQLRALRQQGANYEKTVADLRSKIDAHAGTAFILNEAIREKTMYLRCACTGLLACIAATLYIAV
jgi:predicted  nucleic acid-binding Zn-ribbon protein